MKAVRVVLVPRDTSSVTFGVTSEISVTSIAPCRSSVAPEKDVIAIGTSSRLSSRRRAVTTMSPRSLTPAGAAALSSLGGAESWAAAGLASAARPAPSSNRARDDVRMSIIIPPLRAADIWLVPGVAARILKPEPGFNLVVNEG